MARDAIARQYDVDKNRVTLTCEIDKGDYRPGVITFFPKQGKSLDLHKIEESIRATRLSGGTSMSMDFLEITATGKVVSADKTTLLQVAGAGQQFILKDPVNKGNGPSSLERLREAMAAGAKVVSVTGRVEGWTGKFPDVLRGLAKRPADAPVVLFVTDFEAKAR
jgi:hypothetical protein